MAKQAPGKSHREGISIIELGERFPNEDAARKWFESHVWPNGRRCPRCGSDKTHDATHAKMPYRCTDCRSYFSVKTGTALESSKIALRKWAFAIYLETTSLNGVSSMKLHRDIKVTQKTAWFMLHRLREAWAREKSGNGSIQGPVEAEETYMGGKRKNMPLAKRAYMTSRGTDGKVAVAGVKDRATKHVRAQVVEHADKVTLQGIVVRNAAPDAKVYTDEAKAYHGLPRDHETVNHKVFEYVRAHAHTNGIESFWATLKRAYHGTFHHISPKHLQRYVSEFAAKHNIRDRDTIDQMNALVAGMVGKRLMYRDLICS